MRATVPRLFHTLPHACGYYPDRLARDLVIDPADPRLAALYGFALEQGFRRAGEHLYLPRCEHCRACQPCRVDTLRFHRDRAQRRCWQRNQDLSVSTHPPSYNEERYALYRRYLAWRHPQGGMDESTPEEFSRFLSASWSPTRFLEFRSRDGQLQALAVTDLDPAGWSAVYTCYAPEAAARSLGIYAVLWQLAAARRQAVPWLYLGFWIAGHPKMDYKRRFQPLEISDGQSWRSFSPNTIPSDRPVSTAANKTSS